jgi:hypothetical protein
LNTKTRLINGIDRRRNTVLNMVLAPLISLLLLCALRPHFKNF